MKRLDAGSSGGITSGGGADVVTSFSDRWSVIIDKLSRGRGLRPVQRVALEDARILESRQHLVVCAPTNSGKSLLGYAILLDAVLQGRRAILLEPLRALAQEQTDELTDLLTTLKDCVFRQVPKVRISTGDYRLEGEFPSAAPPSEGEIIVATPERLDAILRNPEHVEWASSIGAMVVDEAHLLGDPNRGPTLELLIASMLSLKNPPRIALLSATLGNPELLRKWLHPCQIVSSTLRTPLVKEVWQLEAGENPDEALSDALRRVLTEPSNAALVFVYRRDSAEALAHKLSIQLGVSVLDYHSGLSASERAQIRADFLAGRCRCLVATTALAMGVNLPATHVFVRDTTFFGFGRLSIQELVQILGRAGRGDRAGIGVILLRQRDEWDGEKLSLALRSEVLPPLRSSFAPLNENGRSDAQDNEGRALLAAATLVASCLGRFEQDGFDARGFSVLLSNTLGARSLTARIDPALRWLTDPSRAIAYRNEQGRYHLTVLGNAGVRAMLPLTYLAAVGQLIRDLMSLDPEMKVLRRWSALDHLFVAALVSERSPTLRRFSEKLADQVDAWLETRPSENKSVLFSEWVMGSSQGTKADQLLGSLAMSSVSPHEARKNAYVSMLSALVLDEHSNGASMDDIERRWGLHKLDGIEESWRDNVMWLLSGQASLLEIRCFYHHLVENCAATPAQIRSTKYILGAMRRLAYELLERLKYCSPLGPLVQNIKSLLSTTSHPTLGVGTIRKLEAAGVLRLQQLAAMDVDDLIAAGIQKRYAKQIRAYVQRRLR